MGEKCMLTTTKQNEFISILLKVQERQAEPEKFLLCNGISINENEFIRITFKLIKW